MSKKDKIIKKGTRAKLWCESSQWCNTYESEIIILKCNYTEKDLEDLSREYMNENLQPDYGYELNPEEDQDEEN